MVVGTSNAHCLPSVTHLKAARKAHFRLSKAYVAAQQTVHGVLPFHVILDFPDTAHLVVGFLVLKMGFKNPAPLVIRRESVTDSFHTLRIQAD